MNIFSKDNVISRVRDNYTYFGDEDKINIGTAKITLTPASGHPDTIVVSDFKKYFYFKDSKELVENNDDDIRATIKVNYDSIGTYTFWHRTDIKVRVEDESALRLPDRERSVFSRDQRVSLYSRNGKSLDIKIETTIDKDNYVGSPVIHRDKYRATETISTDKSELYIVMIFVGTNNPPIVHVSDESYSGISLFASNSIYDSTKSKFEIEKSVITNDVKKYNCPIMSYEEKAKDILRYLDNESITIDNDGEVISYSNDKTSVVFTRINHEKSSKLYITIGQGHLLSEIELDNDNCPVKVTNITMSFDVVKDEDGRISYKDITRIEDSELETDSKDYKIIADMALSCYELLGAEDANDILITSCKKYIDSDDIYAICNCKSTGEPSVIRYYAPYKDEEVGYFAISGYEGTSNYVLDSNYNIIISSVDNNGINYEDISGLKYVKSLNVDSASGSIELHYSDPFVTFDTLQADNPADKKIISFTSSLYSKADEYIYMRDQFGIPYKVKIN